MTPKRVIGNNGELPWRLPSDLKRFRAITTGRKNVIMGRKTWKSIPEKFRPLSGRTNIVLTRQKGFEAAGAIAVASLQEALDAVAGPEVCVIGGARVYELFLSVAKKIFITTVCAEIEGDTLFPALDWTAWHLLPGITKQEKFDPRDQYETIFQIYERK